MSACPLTDNLLFLKEMPPCKRPRQEPDPPAEEPQPTATGGSEKAVQAPEPNPTTVDVEKSEGTKEQDMEVEPKTDSAEAPLFLSCDVRVRRTASSVFLQLQTKEGPRDALHQLLQFFKNKLTFL